MKAGIILKSFIFTQLIIIATNTAIIHPSAERNSYGDNVHQSNSINKNVKKSLNQKMDSSELKKEYWLEKGRQFAKIQSARKPNTNIAKNVILFIGDGMSLTTIAATRMYLGGEEKELFFEKFPHTGFTKTYSIDRIVPDSASTSTAYMTGVKANYYTIGLNGHAQFGDCNKTLNHNYYTESIGKWAQDFGKSTGLVTTTRVTHASPAGMYAHVGDRHWECDADVKKSCGVSYLIPDIAFQLIHGNVGSNIDVVLGGGSTKFRSTSMGDEGERLDGKDLIEEWKILGKSKKEKRTFVDDRENLMKVNSETTDKLIGLFTKDHMYYHLEAEEMKLDMPTLSEMVKKAIEVLKKKDKGFFLFVEGGKIDIAHHAVNSKLAFDETAEYDKAVEMAKSMTDEEDTLIVVTADHSHTMSYSGYSDRKNDIFGESSYYAEDKKPYLTISYANGPSYQDYYNTSDNARFDPRTIDRSKTVTSKWPSYVPIAKETHGGEDVPVYASGPWSHLFTGVYEQNVLPHLMAYASCIGKGLKACDGKNHN